MPVSKRIQVVMDEQEIERFRRQAAAEGLSLSAWLRGLAHQRLESAERESRLASVEDLRDFWQVCDAASSGREPDWEAHLGVMRRSRDRGASDR